MRRILLVLGFVERRLGESALRARTRFAGKLITFMGNQLHDAYYGEFSREGHLPGVAPAGDAWLRAIASGIAVANPYAPESGKLDLWAVDNNHPSAWGAYLNACVIFQTVTGRDPRALGAAERAAAASRSRAIGRGHFSGWRTRR